MCGRRSKRRAAPAARSCPTTPSSNDTSVSLPPPLPAARPGRQDHGHAAGNGQCRCVPTLPPSACSSIFSLFYKYHSRGPNAAQGRAGTGYLKRQPGADLDEGLTSIIRNTVRHYCGARVVMNPISSLSLGMPVYTRLGLRMVNGRGLRLASSERASCVLPLGPSPALQPLDCAADLLLPCRAAGAAASACRAGKQDRGSCRCEPRSLCGPCVVRVVGSAPREDATVHWMGQRQRRFQCMGGGNRVAFSFAGRCGGQPLLWSVLLCSAAPGWLVGQTEQLAPAMPTDRRFFVHPTHRLLSGAEGSQCRPSRSHGPRVQLAPTGSRCLHAGAPSVAAREAPTQQQQRAGNPPKLLPVTSTLQQAYQLYFICSLWYQECAPSDMLTG